MREVKFKAIYKPDLTEYKKYLPFVVKEIDYKLCWVCEKDEEIIYPFFAPFLDKDWLLLQYTGLQDKDGKKICEGDIIEIFEMEIGTNKRYAVKYRKGAFYINRTLLGEYHPSWLKVIGNIYENPKLLNA